MEKEGSVLEATLEECPYICPVVLIDKLSEQKQPRIFPDPELHCRYRVTVDLRGYNALQLQTCDHSGQSFLLPKALCTIDEKKQRKAVHHNQATSFDILSRMPIEKGLYFSKLDLKDAYGSVFLPPDMQHCAVECYDHTAGRSRFFKLTALVQGWKYSPSFFRMTAHFLVERSREKLAEFQLSEHIFIAHFQDDILACSDNPQRLVTATNIIMTVLTFYAFHVRPEKVITAATRITFCGYTLSEYGVRPSPTRRAFTAQFISNLWDNFIATYPDPQGVCTWIRSVAGSFQYLTGYLDPASLASITTLYNTLSQIMRGGDVPAASSFKDPFDTLCTYVINGLPNFYLGSFQNSNVLASVILTDANQSSWSGLLLKIIATDLEKKTSDFVFDELLAEMNLQGVVFPVRLFGGKFSTTTQKQSSTYRERVAQLLMVEQCYPLLEGEVTVISDNRNCIQTWHSIEHNFGGSLIPLFHLYCQCVHETLWINREALPSIADLAARTIAQCNTVTVAPTPVTANLTLLEEIILLYQQDDTQYFGNPLKGEQSQQFFENINGIRYFKAGPNRLLYIPDGRCRSIPFGEHGLRKALLLLAHGDSHVGIFQTRNQLGNVWWPNLSKDVAT
jgi:hypothetical protein